MQPNMSGSSPAVTSLPQPPTLVTLGVSLGEADGQRCIPSASDSTAGGRARYLLSNAKKINSARKSDMQSVSVSHKEGFPACQDRNPITAG